jgi:hypothetical protein
VAGHFAEDVRARIDLPRRLLILAAFGWGGAANSEDNRISPAALRAPGADPSLTPPAETPAPR